jgi:BirA family biotin operon repressor/biotin-[acetyl-CoA-carboxylase] ligase
VSTLAGPVHPLDEASLRRALVVDGGLWRGLEVRAETGSTNADLATTARAGAPEGLVLVAEHQRAGRGRSGRSWTSPPGAGIAVSVLLRPSPPVPVWGWLPLLAGVAMAEAVAGHAGLPATVPATLKWPNDLLVGGGKAGGVLAEVVGDAVVLGVGINVTTRAHELPDPVPGAPPATSLVLAGAVDTRREPLLVALLGGIGSWYARWTAAGGDPDRCGLRAAYLARCATVGRSVRVLLPGGDERAGAAVTVDGQGRLVVRGSAGADRAVAAGDVVHLRAG